MNVTIQAGDGFLDHIEAYALVEVSVTSALVEKPG